MKELDYMRQKGILISKKQYKLILTKMISIMLVFLLMIMGGASIMMFNTKENIIIAGVCIFLFGVVALIFYGFYAMWRYSGKLQLYLHYKKYPEDFENELNVENDGQQDRVKAVPSFLELVNNNEDFTFIYEGKKYELIYFYDKGDENLNLYDDNSGTFIQSFKDKEDLLLNGEIEGKKISEILNDIIIC